MYSRGQIERAHNPVRRRRWQGSGLLFRTCVLGTSGEARETSPRGGCLSECPLLCCSFLISDQSGGTSVGFSALTGERWLGAEEGRVLRASELLGEKTAYRIISLNDLTDVCGFLFFLVLCFF